jgi:hypothetical protein
MKIIDHTEGARRLFILIASMPASTSLLSSALLQAAVSTTTRAFD